MATSIRTRQARRNGFSSAAAQTVAHSLAAQFSKLLGKYVDPTGFCFNEAVGYWAHNHQDVKRIAGHFRTPGSDMHYTFESWDHTLSALAKSGCHIVDVRGIRNEDSMFILEKGKRKASDDTSDDWYSGPQVDAINGEHA